VKIISGKYCDKLNSYQVNKKHLAQNGLDLQNFLYFLQVWFAKMLANNNFCFELSSG
jgi:hypothetical protein